MSQLERSKLVLMRWPVFLALLILAFTGAVKWRASLMPENTYVPSPTGPIPNARSYFLQAEALLKPAIGDAAAQLPPPAGLTPAQLADYPPIDHVYTLAEKDELVNESRPAFEKLEQGLAYPYFAVQPRSFDYLLPFYAADRNMARVLSFAGRTRSAHGDWGDAMNYYLDAIQLGADLPHGAIPIGALVGIACEAISRRSAETAIDHLNLLESERAIRRLETMDSDRETLPQTLTEAKWSTQGSLLEIFRNKDWHKTLGIISDSGEGTFDPFSQSGRTAIVLLLKYQTESPRTAYDNFTDYMTKLISFGSLSWSEQTSHSGPPIPTDPVNQILLPLYSRLLFKIDENATLDRLMELQIALHAYELQHKNYPQTLLNLTPHYLSRLPTDPFNNDQNFKYEPVGSQYLLYSVGPDTVDDGGSPIMNPDKPGQPYQINDENQKGDIVAGLNR